MTLDSRRHPITFALSSSLSRSSSARWLSKISSITVLGSAATATGSVSGLRRRRRRFLILAISDGAGSGCFFVRRFRLGMFGRIASSR